MASIGKINPIRMEKKPDSEIHWNIRSYLHHLACTAKINWTTEKELLKLFQLPNNIGQAILYSVKESIWEGINLDDIPLLKLKIQDILGKQMKKSEDPHYIVYAHGLFNWYKKYLWKQKTANGFWMIQAWEMDPRKERSVKVRKTRAEEKYA